MKTNRIKVKALVNNDLCKKWEIISIKETIYNEYYKDKFEIVKENAVEKGLKKVKNFINKFKKNDK